MISRGVAGFLLLFFCSSVDASSMSYHRCSQMVINYQTDRPPFDGKTISCIFHSDYNLTELEETAKELGASLHTFQHKIRECEHKAETCRMCEHVTLPRVDICKMVQGGYEGPSFCKHIQEEARVCRSLDYCHNWFHRSCGFPRETELVIKL